MAGMAAGRAAPRPGEPGGLEAHGSGLRAPRRAARGVRAAAPRRLQRRGAFPAAAAPEPEGEKDMEHEGVASELTAGSI